MNSRAIKITMSIIIFILAYIAIFSRQSISSYNTSPIINSSQPINANLPQIRFTPSQTPTPVPLSSINPVTCYKTLNTAINPDEACPNTIRPRDISSNGVKIPILLYHHIEDVKNMADYSRRLLSIGPEDLEKQLKIFQENNYLSFFISDVPKILSGETPIGAKNIILTFDDGYEDFYLSAFPLLKKYNMKATIYLVYNLIGKRGYLAHEEVNELLQSELIEIGSHGMDHVSLRNASKDMLEKQIIESKMSFKKFFNIETKTFAYPYGDYSLRIAQFAKEAGYMSAVAIDKGSLLNNKNLFYLPRIRAGMFIQPNTLRVLKSYE